MNLHDWCKHHFNVVQDGVAFARIKLLSHDGSTWNTWEAPFGTPEEFADNAMTLLGQLAEEWPAKRIQVTFIGEDPQGGVRSQCLVSVQGKNPQGKNQFLTGESQALAQSMDAQAKTMEKILGVAGAQAERLGKIIEAQQEHAAEMYKFIQGLRENIAMTQPQQDPSGDALKQMLAQQMPNIIQAVLMKIATPSAPNSAKVNGAASTAAGSAPSA
jgi:hypothetical protein